MSSPPKTPVGWYRHEKRRRERRKDPLARVLADAKAELDRQLAAALPKRGRPKQEHRA